MARMASHTPRSKSPPSCQTLRLRSAGIRFLDDGLLHFEALEELNLSGNSLSGAALKNLPPSLRVLNVYNNALEDLAVVGNSVSPTVPIALVTLEELVHLGAGYNAISSFGILALPACFPHILSLDLSFNALDCFEKLCPPIGHLPSLVQLVLAGNPVRPCARPALEYAPPYLFLSPSARSPASHHQVCLLPHYRRRVVSAVPWLQVLDDHAVQPGDLTAGTGLARLALQPLGSISASSVILPSSSPPPPPGPDGFINSVSLRIVVSSLTLGPRLPHAAGLLDPGAGAPTATSTASTGSAPPPPSSAGQPKNAPKAGGAGKPPGGNEPDGAGAGEGPAIETLRQYLVAMSTPFGVVPGGPPIAPVGSADSSAFSVQPAGMKSAAPIHELRTPLVLSAPPAALVFDHAFSLTLPTSVALRNWLHFDSLFFTVCEERTVHADGPSGAAGAAPQPPVAAAPGRGRDAAPPATKSTPPALSFPPTVAAASSNGATGCLTPLTPVGSARLPLSALLAEDVLLADGPVVFRHELPVLSPDGEVVGECLIRILLHPASEEDSGAEAAEAAPKPAGLADTNEAAEKKTALGKAGRGAK